MIKSFFRTALYYTIKALCIVVLKVYSRLKVTGRELIPEKRPVIVAANHTSNLDPVVVGCVFPGRLRPLGKVELFRINRPFTWLMNNLGVIPLDRESGASAAMALKDFLGLLKNGENLMIFPEGGRSLDGRLKPLEGGTAVLSVSTGAPIVPLYISGAFESMPVGAKTIKRHPIAVRFGNPIFPLPKEKRGTSKEERERIRLALENELKRLENESIG
ncbi:MAG: lysophospholipid acyltransferase family protein [Pyramidobacter sp.]|jgi:1-acyl-sn-glycerol-3-phosphate acyltransferase